MKNAKDAREAIIKLIAFFDLCDYPLTAYEIWEKVGQQCSLAEVSGLLDGEISKDMAAISQKWGFYCLKGREGIVGTRMERHNHGARKLAIAKRFARLFSSCPSVMMVAMANAIGQNNLRDGSDIDFFIVSAPRRVWLTRLYCTGLAKLLNCRPKAGDKRDKICLSFYIAADRLCLDGLRLGDDDPYLDHWRQSLVLLYNKEKTYERFLQANESPDIRTASTGEVLPRSAFWDRLEALAKRFQLAIMPAGLKSLDHNSDGVVIGDSIIKLYQRDRRREYAEKYGNKVNEIIKEDN